MTIELKQHIELRGDNPLDAVIAETNLKAYLVANLAINDGAESSAAHYGLDLATIYAALMFHYDNEQAIREAREEDMRLLREMGMRDSSEVLAEIRLRHAKKTENLDDN
jgi:hypothetical protein